MLINQTGQFLNGRSIFGIPAPAFQFATIIYTRIFSKIQGRRIKNVQR